MHKAGERVFAALDAKDGVYRLLGYGVYEGLHDLPDIFMVGLGRLLTERGYGTDIKIQNPRIRLDSGDVVWGCECWWGSEAKLKQRVVAGEAQVEMVELSVLQRAPFAPGEAVSKEMT